MTTETTTETTAESPTDTLSGVISTEFSKLLLLGFSTHQARTIITSAFIRAANESKLITPASPVVPAPKPSKPPRPAGRRVDTDGDTWEPVDPFDKEGLWQCTSIPSLGTLERSDLESFYGPTRKERK
jgi:hypothetical protein